MKNKKQIPVFFRQEERNDFELLKDEGWISESFPSFVKSAFYNKFDPIKQKRAIYQGEGPIKDYEVDENESTKNND